jgi:hypothetical protein
MSIHFINYKFVKSFCQSLEGSSQIVLKPLCIDIFSLHGYFHTPTSLCMKGYI